MKQKIRLTKSEREIMDVLWKQGEALTSSEIIEFSTNRSWSNTSIHLLLKSLLDKSVIEVDGFKRIAKIMPELLGLLFLNMIIFFKKISKKCL